MKKRKNFAKRSLSVFLCLVMALSMLQITAFAAEDDGTVTKEIPASEGQALIPSNTEPTVTISESGATEAKWEWGGTTTTDNDYSNKTTTSSEEQTTAVDKITEGSKDDLDKIPDGTYTKTEVETKTDVTVKIKGDQTKVTEENGDYVLNGQQTTTTTITDSTKTTTTEVTKETTEEKTGETKSPEVVTVEEENTVATEGEKTTTATTEGDLDKITVNLGNDLINGVEINSKELTVSATHKKESDTGSTTAKVNTDNVTRDLLTALDGWTVTAGGKSAIVKANDDGSVSYVDADGNAVEGFKVSLVDDGNGNYSIVGTKTTSPTVVIPGTSATTSDKGKDTEGTAEDIVWSEDGYEQVGEAITNEDGSVTVKYVKKGTANRTDTNEWTEVTTRTDGMKIVEQKATVSATLTNGDYTVNAAWKSIKDNNAKNDQTVITVLGPSQKVFQIALNSRNSGDKGAISKHLIIATAFKDMSAAEIAAMLNGTDNNGTDMKSLYLEGVFMQSSVFIKDASGGGTGAWLRRMSDGNGGYFYVYCAQHGKGTTDGTSYEIVNIDEQGYLYTQNANHIQYIVEHGWWGTDSGTGSLSTVKKLISKDYRSSLDEGIAMAVTQAAIWYYTSAGHDGNKTINPDEDIFIKAWADNSGNSYKNLNDTQKAAAMELFNALIQRDKTDAQMASKVNNTTDFIHKDDITSTSIQVVEKVEANSVEDLTKLVQESLSTDASAKNDANKGKTSVSDMLDSGKDLYKANVSVTLAVLPSKLNSDDLMIYVYSGDTLVGSKRVDQAALEANSGKVTIENVVLENGAKVRFHLDGTQNLTEGAYLFRSDVNCTGSQTMVGYVTGSTTGNKVNVDVNMTFNVVKTNGSFTGSAEVDGKTTTYDETHTTTTKKSSTTDVTENHEKTVIVTTTVTVKEESEDTVVKEAVKWSDTVHTDDEGDDDADADADADADTDSDTEVEIPSETTPLTETTETTEIEEEISDEETPLTELTEEEEEIPDEEVPLSDVPQTGDISAMWYAITVLSAAGLMCMVVLERKKRQAE